MPNEKWTAEHVTEAVEAFVGLTDTLTARAWDGWARSNATAPSSATVAARFAGGKTFSLFLCEYAAANVEPDRRLTWGMCPQRTVHSHPSKPWEGTAAEWREGVCERCTASDERAAERSAARPSEWRTEVEEALTDRPEVAALFVRWDGDQAVFRCASCGADTWWSPRQPDRPPACRDCFVVGEAQPGDTVPRRGGGARVVRDADVAAWLERDHGLVVVADLGVVVRGLGYVVPVIKPDLLLSEERVAVEIDLDDHRADMHARDDRAADDRRRDELLASVGWPVLRVRRAHHPVVGDWPWRVVPTTEGVGNVAATVAAAVSERRDTLGKVKNQA